MPSLLLLLFQLTSAAPVDVRDVTVPSFDGATLAATYYDPGKPGPGAVFFRNCDQKRVGVDAFARTLSARGVHVIAYDYRGGEAKGLGWSETRSGDADRVHDWLVAQPNVDRSRLVAIGGSCGVSLALDFAMKHAASLRGVVILSGPSDSLHLVHVARTPSLGVLGAGSVEEGAGVANVEPVVKASRNPASRVVVVPAGHGTDILKRDAAFATTALAWIIERLGASSPSGERSHSP